MPAQYRWSGAGATFENVREVALINKSAEKRHSDDRAPFLKKLLAAVNTLRCLVHMRRATDGLGE
jgi:hypothetical protein